MCAHSLGGRGCVPRWTNGARRAPPVTIRLTRHQADRLAQDWYYGHARYEETADGYVLMIFGEANREIVLELLRWLGPGAELLEPRAWRTAAKEELLAMLAHYNEGGG